MRHQVIVLGDGESDTRDVSFLESVGTDQLAADLAGDANDGRGIQHGGGNAGHHICGAGA